MSKKLPVIHRVRMEPGKIGTAFQAMKDFINGRTVTRIEIVAESAVLERTSAKKLRRRVVGREHRFIVELTQPTSSIDKRRRGA